MPDLVVRLLGESAQYSATMARAESDTNRFDRQLESLTTTMQRQSEAKQFSSREAQVLAIADKGASVAAAEYALSVAKELDSLEALAAAEAKAAAAKDAAAATSRRIAEQQQATAQRTVTSLEQEKVLLTQGATAARVYAIQQTDLSERVKNVLISLTMRNAALAQSAAAEAKATAATAENQSWVAKTIQTEHQAARAYSESSIYLKLKEAAQRGATEAEIAEIHTAIMVQQRNDQVTEGYRRRTAAMSQATSATQSHSNSSRTNMLAIQALAFGLQDAAQVYGTTGLAGAISASANNLIFMTSLLSPHLAIVTAVGVAVGQFAVVLGPAIMGIKDQAKATEELIKQQTEQMKLQETINQQARSFNRAMEEAKDFDSSNSVLKQQESALRDVKEEQDQIQQVINDQRAKRDARKFDMAFTVGDKTNIQKEIDAYNKRIFDEQTKIVELSSKQLVLEQQVAKAKEKTAILDREKRAADSRQHARDQEQAMIQAEQKAYKEKAEADAAANKKFIADRKRALQEVRDFEKQLRDVRIDSLSEDDAKRQKLVDELNQRLQDIQTWKQAQIVTYSEAAQARMAAERAFRVQALQLEDEFAQRNAKEDKAAKDKAAKEAKEANKDLNKPLTAIETNSTDSFKRIFDATNGGQGPMEGILKQELKNGRTLETLVTLYSNAIDVMKKNVVKVK